MIVKEICFIIMATKISTGLAVAVQCNYRVITSALLCMCVSMP